MKNYLLFLLIFISSFVISQVPTAGLISNWPFSGNANDMVGGNNGTVFNATLTADRFGNSGCAYNFNGTSSYILFVAAGPTGTLSRTVSFWAKSTNTITTIPFGITAAFAYGDGASSGAYAIQFNYGCAGVGFDIGTSEYIRSASNVSDGNWHHYAAVYNSTVSTQIGSIDFYMDGVPLSVMGCGGSTLVAMNSNSVFPVTIGKVADKNIRYFNGDLDDFYLYNRALTSGEVLALFNDVPCTVIPPSPGAISGNISVCQGASYVYSVAPVPGATSYSWTLPGGWTGTSTTNTILVTAGANSGTVAVACGNCCGSSQGSSQDVNVNPSPSLTISATQFTICKGNSTTLYGNGAGTYTWNSSVVTSSLVVSPTVTSTYSVSGTNSFGCSSSTVTTVNVINNTLPAISVTGPGPSCTNQTVNLAANGASTYTWQPGGMNGFFVSVSPGITTVYTVTGTDANGCYNSATYTQTVSSCTGVKNLQSGVNSFSVYPNPNNGSFTVKSSDTKKNTRIEITNEAGQLIYATPIEQDETRLNLKLTSGLYLIRLLNGNQLLGIQKLNVISN